MSYEYIKGQLSYRSAQNGKTLNLLDLAKKYGTPLYVYDLDDVEIRVKKFKEAFGGTIQIHYAMKANFHPLVLEKLKELGVGLDIVSGGELSWAEKLGFSAQQCVFSGVGKKVSEIRTALENGIFQINVESPAELVRIAEVARTLGKKAPVAFRMNPDVSVSTHPYIQTGFRENKFGMDGEFLPELLQILRDHSDHLDLLGLTLHIGSQIRDLSAFSEAVSKVKLIWKQLLAVGFNLRTFDIGGGLGINYADFATDEEFSSLSEYGRRMTEALADLGPVQRLAEPGRILVGRMGMLLTEVQYIKTTPSKNFAIVDTGMHHLLRPALYQAQHRIIKLGEVEAAQMTYDVVGPICESSDVVGHERRLSRLEQGDFLAIADTGAYGYVLASHYNLHKLPRQICLSRGEVLES